MFVGWVIRRGFFPAAVLVSETKSNQSQEENEQKQENICRPSELPIYTPNLPKLITTKQNAEEGHIFGFIEDSIRTVRQTLSKYSEEYRAYEKVAKQSISESKENVEWLIDYLRQEDNTLPKAGAVGIGALTGLIFGLRGGVFKKTLYATSGALGMAAVCYPKEASEYTQQGIVEGKKYLTIAYNFAYGVKQDEPPLELPSLPKLPSNFNEAWESVKNTATSFVSTESEGKTADVKKAGP